MELVINKCWGGFCLSKEACEILGCSAWSFSSTNDRHNLNLVNCVKKLGVEAASGPYANLKIIKLPDETTDWEIIDNDGVEIVIYVVDGLIYRAY